MTDISKGIRFEESDILLEWGQPIDKLIDIHKGKKVNKGDRTVYYWGTHKILNGLALDLMNSYWNFGQERKKRDFDSIEYWAVGDRLAIEAFDKISKHLLKQINEPTEKDDISEIERSWIWKLDSVIIHLYIFEQHSLKLSLTIKKEY